MIFTDQLERKVLLKETPKRIVSLVPSLTELLVDLDLEDAIIGITKFCIHPNHLGKSKTVVGGTKQIHLDKIIALKPDIVLCNKEENTKEMIDGIEAIAPVHISDIVTLEDAFELIKMYGSLFNVQGKANDIIIKIKSEREAFQLKTNNYSPKRVAYFIWRKPWMVVGSDTFINTMIKEAGYVNVYESLQRYPEISLDNQKLKEADVVFLSSEPYPFKEKHIEEFKKLFPNKMIKIVDGELFSWYGSRLMYSYKYFDTL